MHVYNRRLCLYGEIAIDIICTFERSIIVDYESRFAAPSLHIQKRHIYV